MFERKNIPQKILGLKNFQIEGKFQFFSMKFIESKAFWNGIS
jgi:hypothetical protein